MGRPSSLLRSQTAGKLLARMCNCDGPRPEYGEEHASWCLAYAAFKALPMIEAEASAQVLVEARANSFFGRWRARFRA